ncbi:MAG: hypothetical protein RLO18_30570, partial [Gimesia chilikensis]
MAGDKVIAGGQEQVLILEADSGKVLQTLKVTGKARGLAVSDGQLVVSTSAGDIIGFGSSSTPTEKLTELDTVSTENPYAKNTT